MLVKRLRRRKISPRSFWAWEEEPEGGGGVEISEGGATAEIASPGSTSPAPETVKFDLGTLIPEDLRDRDYFKNIMKAEDPAKELVTQFHNAQGLIGKKGTPAPDATEEEWNQYFESVRPKTSDDYDIKPLELGEDDKDVAEYIKSKWDEEYVKQVKDVMHKWGFTKKQAEGVMADIDRLKIPAIKAQIQAEKDLDAHFDTLAKNAFGGNKDKALDAGKKFVKEFASDKTKAYMNGLPNESLLLIADMAVAVAKKYEKEDTVVTDSSTIDGAQTYEQLQSELHKIYTSPEFMDPFHQGNKAIIQKKEQIIAKMVALEKARK